MKILVAGDFHGKFPEEIKKVVKEQKIEIVLALGDYAGIHEWRIPLRKVFLASAKGKKLSVEMVLGKKAFKKLEKKDFEAGKKVLIALNKLGVRVFSVFGNGDWYCDFFNRSNRKYENTIKKLKNIKNINKGFIKFRGVKIMGYGGYMDPDAYFTKIGKKAINDSNEKNKRRMERYLENKEEFLSMMKKYRPDILVAHYPAYGYCDKMKAKWSALNGEHMGIKFFNEGIKKYKTKLMVCGHIHEAFGECQIGKTIVVNPGAANEGKFVILDYK
jgi:Icc-related predicted phosphoesterase